MIESELTSLTFWVAFATLSVIVGGKLYDRFWLNRKPNVEFTVRKNPLVYEGNNQEEGVKEFRIPPKKKIILYFVIKVKDKRHYRDCHVWIKFPEKFGVDHHYDYENLEWGKGVTKRTKHQIGYKVETPLTNRKLLDAVYLPVIVNIPQTLGDYKVKVQFWSESIKSDSTVHEVILKVVENDYSHDGKMFKPETFRL